MVSTRFMSVCLAVSVLLVYTLTSVQSAPTTKRAPPKTKAPPTTKAPARKAPKTTKPPPTTAKPKPPPKSKPPQTPQPPQPTPPPTIIAPQPCQDVVCAAVACDTPILTEGECCPSCPATSCEVFGAQIPIGETHYFSADMYCVCESAESMYCVA